MSFSGNFFLTLSATIVKFLTGFFVLFHPVLKFEPDCNFANHVVFNDDQIFVELL